MLYVTTDFYYFFIIKVKVVMVEGKCYVIETAEYAQK